MSLLWGILPALGLPLTGAAVYLLGFTLGSITAMGLFTAGASLAFNQLGKRLPLRIRQARLATSALCAIVGAAWFLLAVHPVGA